MNAHVNLSDSKRQLLEKMLRGAEPAARVEPIAPRAPDAPIPLSADQRQVWLHAIMAPDVPLYNESITIHRFGSFDRAAMERSVNEILRRHEAWRTAFVEEGGELVQCVRPHRDIALPYDDVSHLPEAERDAAALKIGSDDARRAIDAGADAIYCSNHGGRQANGGIAAIDLLPGVVEAAGDTPVLFDSGVRSGSDVAKALALGATAVGIGRPYCYGLALGGVEGAVHVLRSLLAEADLLMAVDGFPDIAALRAAGAVRL